MIDTAIKEDLILDKKLIIPKNKLDAIRIMNELHPVAGGQPTHEKDQPNDNNPILDLACTLANIHASGVGEHADLRSIQNEPPRFFYGEGFISGISSLKGNGILAIFGHWRDGSGNYAIKQFYYTDKEISYRNALSEDKWSAWIDILTSNSQLDYNKLLNVPITSTLSDDKNKIASIFSVNEVNRKAVNAQKTADLANDKAVEANNNANKRSLKTETLLRKGSLSTTNLNDVTEVGNYYQIQNAQATTARNYPKALAGNLFVLEATGGATDCIQIYTTYSTNKLFVRNKYGATWSAWKETADELDVVKAQSRADAAFTRVKPIAEGGTGGTTVAAARTNLGLKGAALVDITSTLSDAKDLAASIFSVNEINRKANTAQTTGNNADAKAVKAQARADAAFTRVKPITEGGTGAKSVSVARTNLGLGNAATENVARSIASDDNDLVNLGLLKENISKYALIEFGEMSSNATKLMKSPFGSIPAITVTEVFVDNKWMKAGWFSLGNGSAGAFTYGAESYVEADQIRVVTGSNGVTYIKPYSPNMSTKHLVSGKIRVHVWT